MRGVSETSNEGRCDVRQSALDEGLILRPEKNPGRSRRSGFEFNKSGRLRPPVDQ